jgi:hypothetical protein
MLIYVMLCYVILCYVVCCSLTKQTSDIGSKKEYTEDSSLLGCDALFLDD